MKSNTLIRLLMIIFFLFFLFNAVQAEKKEINKVFDKKDLVKIITVSGDCIIKTEKGSKIRIQLMYDYPTDCFKPEFQEQGSTLAVNEEFSDDEFSGHCSGRSLWKIWVPENTGIEFKSASGDISVEDLKNDLSAATASGDFELKNISGKCTIKTASGDLEARDIAGTFEVKTASGDIDMENISGSIDIKTASGDIDAQNLNGDEISLKGASSDIEVKDSTGAFSLKTASGEVQAEGISITKASEFKTASGDVYVKLAKSPDCDLTLASASGDAVLTYNGNPIYGAFEFSAKDEDGQIESPFKFDKEEIIIRYGQKYQKKSFTKKANKPVIVIKTASGKAALEE